MKWFKQFIERFSSKDDEELYFEEENFEENSVEKNVNEKKPFRFPIIDDFEINQPAASVKENDYIKNDFVKKDIKKESIHTEIYDVKEPGIRELLEQRRKQMKNSRNFSSYNPKPLKFQEPAKLEPKQKKIEKVPLYEPTIIRKHFVPTEVPSPIYGFQKRKTLKKESAPKKEEKLKQSFPSSVGHVEKQEHLEFSNLKEKSYIEKTQANKLLEIDSKQNEIKQNEFISQSVEIQSNTVKEEVVATNVSNNQLSMEENVTDFNAFDEEQSSQKGIEEEQTETKFSIDNKIEENDVIDTNSEFKVEEPIEEVQVLSQEVLQENSLTNYDDNKVDEPAEEQLTCDESEIELEEKDFQPVEEEQTEQNGFIEQMEQKEELVEQGSTNLHVEKWEQKEEKNVQFINEEAEITESTENKIEDVEIPTEENHHYQIVEDEQIKEQENEEQQINATDQPYIMNKNEGIEKKSTGSSLPFNVLMLKSDKEKLAKKIAQSMTPLQTALNVNQNKEQQLEEVEKEEPKKSYTKPPIHFLTPPEEKIIDKEWMESQAEKLVEALSYFQISAEVQSIMQGPAVTQFEITVAHGIKVSKIRNLSDDLKLALAAKDIRIQAPIPGKSTIGIEIPNRISRAVRLSEIASSQKFLQSDSPLEAALGLDLTGNPITIDLRKMPHGLIAGATGSGKSVCINSILVSLLYKANPDELKLMLIDPKIVELAPYNNIPHLVSPVITDVKAATAALKWAVEEMERRYHLFAQSGVRDLPRFNAWALKNNEQPLPYILIVIDELADLMMMAPTDVEDAICRIAQKARACGIHLIVATQRPSVDVLTGLIKSNIPTRIAFSVSSSVDSRTILDQQGAERLLGRGDMLYLGNGMSAPIRIQGTFVTDDEIESVVDFVKQQGEPNYFFEQEELLKKNEMLEEQDELFEEVCRFVAEQGSASTSSIQRRYHIGYNRAARLIDMLEQQGFISEQRGSKPREVYITVSDLASMFKE